jgi:negative regulator of sigma E activity
MKHALGKNLIAPLAWKGSILPCTVKMDVGSGRIGGHLTRLNLVTYGDGLISLSAPVVASIANTCNIRAALSATIKNRFCGSWVTMVGFRPIATGKPLRGVSAPLDVFTA